MNTNHLAIMPAHVHYRKYNYVILCIHFMVSGGGTCRLRRVVASFFSSPKQSTYTYRLKAKQSKAKSLNHTNHYHSLNQLILLTSSPNPLRVLNMYHWINIPNSVNAITFSILVHRAIYQVNACHIQRHRVTRSNNSNVP